jgi:hypothetical protein
VRSEQFSVWLGGGARQDTTSNLSGDKLVSRS